MRSLAEIREARGADLRLDAFADEVERRLTNLSEFDPVARRVFEMKACRPRSSVAQCDAGAIQGVMFFVGLSDTRTGTQARLQATFFVT